MLLLSTCQSGAVRGKPKGGVSWQGWGAGLSLLATGCLMPVGVSTDVPNRRCHMVHPKEKVFGTQTRWESDGEIR
jgi:hypothetical protein